MVKFNMEIPQDLSSKLDESRGFCGESKSQFVRTAIFERIINLQSTNPRNNSRDRVELIDPAREIVSIISKYNLVGDKLKDKTKFKLIDNINILSRYLHDCYFPRSYAKDIFGETQYKEYTEEELFILIPEFCNLIQLIYVSSEEEYCAQKMKDVIEILLFWIDLVFMPSEIKYFGFLQECVNEGAFSAIR